MKLFIFVSLCEHNWKARREGCWRNKIKNKNKKNLIGNWWIDEIQKSISLIRKNCSCFHTHTHLMRLKIFLDNWLMVSTWMLSSPGRKEATHDSYKLWASCLLIMVYSNTIIMHRSYHGRDWEIMSGMCTNNSLVFQFSDVLQQIVLCHYELLSKFNCSSKFTPIRQSPTVAQYVTLQKYFSHLSLVIYFFATPTNKI
jgi:hypothetical protein